MKITKRKHTVPTKKRTTPAKRKQAVPVHEAALKGRSGRFWTQWIEPKKAALLSQTLGRCNFVIKNHGPSNVMLMANNGDRMDLPPGAVRATYAYGTITVENRGEKPVLIEFEFLPIHRTSY